MIDTDPAQAANPEPQPQAGEGPQPNDAATAATSWTLEDAIAEVKKLRQEAAKYRKDAQAATKAQQDAQAAALAEQGKYRELYEQAKGKAENADALQARLDALMERTAAANARRVAAIPEAMRSLVPEYDDPFKVADWLDANAATLSKPPLPGLDGGARSNGAAAVTDAEVAEFAARFNLKPENVDRALVAKAIRR